MISAKKIVGTFLIDFHAAFSTSFSWPSNLRPLLTVLFEVQKITLL